MQISLNTTTFTEIPFVLANTTTWVIHKSELTHPERKAVCAENRLLTSVSLTLNNTCITTLEFNEKNTKEPTVRETFQRYVQADTFRSDYDYLRCPRLLLCSTQTKTNI